MTGLEFMAVATLAPLALLLFHLHPRLAWWCSLGGFLLPLTQVSTGFDSRYIIAVATVAQAPKVKSLDFGGLSTKVRAVVVMLMTLVSTFLLSAFWSIDPSRTFSAAAAWVVLLVGLVVFSRVLSRGSLLHDPFRLGLLVLGGSLAVALLRLPFAYEGDRAVGLMANANGLGVLCAMVAPWICRGGASSRTLLTLCIPLGVVVLAGSRAGALGALIGISVVIVASVSGTMRVMSAPALLLVGWVLATRDWEPGVASQTMLLRTNDSRGELWTAVQSEISKNPLFGSGFDTLELIGGSSYLKIAAELGVLGVVLLFLTISFAVKAVWPNPVGLGVLAGGLVNAAFESWLVAAGSFYALMFFVSAVAFAQFDLKVEPHASLAR